MFEHQIKELRQYMNYLDEKIARYQKQGRNTDRLKDNKARARQTIEELKQAEKNNSQPNPIMAFFNPLESKFKRPF